MRLTSATDIGPRSEQQDVCGTVERGGKVLAVVCDGMGGHRDGLLAATTARDVICGPHTRLTEEGLIGAFHEANRAVRRATEAHGDIGGGTTASAVLLDGMRASIAHVGDSRVGLLRAGTLKWLTTEHAIWRSLIAWVGMEPESFQVESASVDLLPGDGLILVSDGITKRLKAPDLVAPLDADAILNAATARGLKDNTTALVIEVTP